MANKEISDLPEASTVGDDDLFLIQQGGTAKKVKRISAKDKRIPKLGNAIGMSFWNQLVKNGNFADASGWNGNRCAVAISNNTMSVTATDANAPKYVFRDLGFAKGHKYFVSFDVYAVEFNEIYIRTYSTSDAVSIIIFDNLPLGQWTHCAGIGSVPADTTRNISRFTFRTSSTRGSGEIYRFKNAMCIDLTALFGEGNEPTTAEEFTDMFPASYYPFCAGITEERIARLEQALGL